MGDEASAPWPGKLDVVIEVPRGGHVKRRDDGGVDFVSPFPCPFNYGSVPDTVSGDGDRLDAVVLGASLKRGARVSVPVVALVHFVDAGLEDPKWICSAEPLTGQERRRIVRFFAFYAYAKRALNLVRGKRGSTRYAGLVEQGSAL